MTEPASKACSPCSCSPCSCKPVARRVAVTVTVTAQVVAAEDTRRLRRLCADLGVEPTGRVVSYHEHNEGTRTDDLVARAAAGATVLLLTDAGMPTVSDPGYRVVVAAAAAGVSPASRPASCSSDSCPSSLSHL